MEDACSNYGLVLMFSYTQRQKYIIKLLRVGRQYTIYAIFSHAGVTFYFIRQIFIPLKILSVGGSAVQAAYIIEFVFPTAPSYKS